MPKKQLRQFVGPDFDLQDDSQLIELAAKFGVSTAAIGYRIQNVYGR